jgi:3-deoxy-D-manno-octulosonate 8-phosphate phosphatase (KDO 8-P phosphatase)
MTEELKQCIQPIRLLLMDVDGTMSDGRLHYNTEWVESKSFDVKDGFGIWMIQSVGIKVGIVTGRESRIVTERARELNIEIVYQGRHYKDEVLNDIQNNYDLQDDEVAYIGDDLFDLPLLKRAGFAAAPADAHPEVKDFVDFVSQYDGGRGAVREVCELILHVQDHWDGLMQKFLPQD